MTYNRENNFSGQYFPTIKSALRLNGTDQYVNLGMPSRFETLGTIGNGFTVSFFVKINGNGNDIGGLSNERSIIGESYLESNSSASFRIIYTDLDIPSKRINFQIRNSTNFVTANAPIEWEKWYHFTGVYNPSTYLRSYLNGALVSEITSGVFSSINSNPDLFYTIGRADYGTRVGAFGSSEKYSEFDIAHLQVFDSVLSSEEIYQIATTGGIIPQSARSSCILHMPFQDDSYYKELSGSTPQYPIVGLTQNSGDKIAFDVSTQYNYAKTTDIDAAHGQLPAAVWDDDELGIFASGVNNTSTINLYGKNPTFRQIARTYDGVNDRDQIGSGLVLVRINTPRTFFMDFYTENETGFNQFFAQHSLSLTNDINKMQLFLIVAFNGFLRVIASNTTTSSGTADRMLVICETKLKKGRNKVAVIYEDTFGENVKFYINGERATTNIFQNDLTLTGDFVPTPVESYIGYYQLISDIRYFNGYFKSFQVTDAVESEDVILQATINGSLEGITPNNLILNIKPNDTGNLTDYGLSGLTITPTRTNLTDIASIGAGGHVDINSGIPVPRQGLILSDNTKYIDLDKDNIEQQNGEFTILLIVKLNPVVFDSSTTIAPYYTVGSNSGSSTGNHIVFARKGSFINYPVNAGYIRYINQNVGNPVIANVDFTEINNNSRFNYYLSFACVQSNNKINGYINGVLKSSNSNIVDFNIPQINRIHNTPVDFNSTTTYDSSNNTTLLSYGWWNRALQPAEIAYLHNSGVPQTPARILAETGTNMQDNMVIWHNFNEGDIIETGSAPQLRNYGSGANGIINGFGTLTFGADNVKNALIDMKDIR